MKHELRVPPLATLPTVEVELMQLIHSLIFMIENQLFIEFY